MNYFHLWTERDLKSLFLCLEAEGLAFYYLPKCGCSSIRKLIEAHSNLEWMKEEERLRFIEKPRCLVKNPEGVNYKIIAIVRNPYDRIISAFQTRDWLVNYRGEYPTGEMFSSKSKSYDDFKRFIDILIEQNPNSCNVHFTPQKLLMDNNLPDVLLKLEDLSSINNFLKDNDIQSMPHENSSKNKLISSEFFNLLKEDKETQKKIEEYYSVDFDFLHYDKLSDSCS